MSRTIQHGYFRRRTIKLRCAECGYTFDEDSFKPDEITGIEEDYLGRDVVKFTCPTCKSRTHSFRHC